MRLKYIFHSGFLVECSNCFYLFDYYQGNLPPLNPDKPLVVLASHHHKDHYNPHVFNLLKQAGCKNVSAVLAKDISPKHYPPETSVLKAYAHQCYQLEYAKLETLLSTDSGVAFLLTTDEGVIYHAGDLNAWLLPQKDEKYNKQMTGSFRHEVDLLKGRHIDCACLPLDPHLGEYYADGSLYFLQTVKPAHFYPMHYWQDEAVTGTFLRQYPAYRDIMVNPQEELII